MLNLPRCMLRPAWLALACMLLLPVQEPAAETYRFTGVERVVAFGDVHGAFDELVSVLRGTGLVDEQLHWSGGGTHLVSLGDLLDRGDYGRQVMDLMMRLGPEASAAGGAVHVVLGNHEVMNLTGDLRYVSAGDYAQFGTQARDGAPAGYHERRAALSPEGHYGRWLLELPVAVVVNDTLFVHGGVSSRLAGLSLEQLNAEARRDVRRVAEGWHALRDAGVLADMEGFDALLAKAPRLAQSSDERLGRLGREISEALDGLPFIPDGPVWYRGSVTCHPYAEIEIADSILRPLGVRRVALGHTPTSDRRITSRLEGRIFGIDTGMNRAAYRGRPAALVIEAGETRAWYEGEGEVPIEAEPNRSWERPYGMIDAEIEAFLLSAEVIAMERMEKAGDSLQKVTLEQGDRRLTAVFNTVDEAPRVLDGRWTRRAERADRFSHEIAAYRLDRLIGLDMIPVTVDRTIDGRRGALRLWLEGSFSEGQRRAEQLAVRGVCSLDPQYQMMSVFDVLIYNTDHELGSLRYDRDGQLWMVDHSQAFGLTRDVNLMLRNSDLKPAPQLADALAEVTIENVASLSPYLHRRQIDALVERAAQLRARR